jgi:type IV pilus assembly protein PilO
MATPSVKIVDRLSLAVVIVVLLLSGYWLFSRGLKEEGLFRSEKEQLTRQMDDKRRAEESIEKMRASIRTTADEVANINRQIPEEGDIGTFLKQLDGLVNKRGVALMSIQPQPAIKEKLCLKIPVRVSCRGSFVSLYNLLRDLDTMSRLVVVERMALGKPEESGYCQLDVTALVFAREPQSSKTMEGRGRAD